VYSEQAGVGTVSEARVPEHSLILIREWEQQMSSSGCCGRLEGDLLEWGGTRCFPERRRHMEEAGSVYRAFRERLGASAEIRVVDPRNFLALLPTLIRDIRRYRVSGREAVRTIFGLGVNSVVLDGRLVARGRWQVSDLLARLEASP